MNRFYSSLADVLEVDEVGPDLAFREVPGWCSLKAFGVLVLMENDWKAPIAIERLADFSSAKDLYREAFLSVLAEVSGICRDNLGEIRISGKLPDLDADVRQRLVRECEARFGIEFPADRSCFPSSVDEFLV